MAQGEHTRFRAPGATQRRVAGRPRREARAQRRAGGVSRAALALLVLALGAGAVAAAGGRAGAFPRATPPEPPTQRESVLAPGVFLVASRRLSDPRFAQTAVLLVDHGDKGSMGLVVNRPTDMRLAELLPEVEELQGRDEVAWVGGPVEPHRVFLLLETRRAPEEARHVFDDVYLSASAQALRAALGRSEPGERLRGYAGYAGWGPGQLEGELARGDWLVVEADARSVFRSDPERLWRELMLRGSLRVTHLPAGTSARRPPRLDAGAGRG